MKTGTIGKTLQQLMEDKGISVKELSAATKVPEQTLYSMLKKTTNQTNIDTLLTLAVFFNKDIKVFFGVEKYKEPVVLSKEETILLKNYRLLNRFGKTRLEEEAVDLITQAKYIQTH